MVELYRDPNGASLFRGHTVISSSAGSLFHGNPLRATHKQEIETLRRRIRELECLLNQPNSHDTTGSSHERECQVESVNQCFTQQGGGGRRVRFAEDLCFTGTAELSYSDGHAAEPTVTTPCEEGAGEIVCANSYLGEGAECIGKTRETEVTRDNDVINHS